MIKVNYIEKLDGTTIKVSEIMQGDSYSKKITFGEELTKQVASATYVVGDKNLCKVFEVAFAKQDDGWYADITSEITLTLAPTKPNTDDFYVTEIRVYYADGNADIIADGILKVAETIKEC